MKNRDARLGRRLRRRKRGLSLYDEFKVAAFHAVYKVMMIDLATKQGGSMRSIGLAVAATVDNYSDREMAGFWQWCKRYARATPGTKGEGEA